MEYANVAQSPKLRNLVEDSYGSALLDTGCSTTVCGVDMLENYSNTLEYMIEIVSKKNHQVHLSLLAMVLRSHH